LRRRRCWSIAPGRPKTLPRNGREGVAYSIGKTAEAVEGRPKEGGGRSSFREETAELEEEREEKGRTNFYGKGEKMSA